MTLFEVDLLLVSVSEDVDDEVDDDDDDDDEVDDDDDNDEVDNDEEIDGKGFEAGFDSDFEAIDPNNSNRTLSLLLTNLQTTNI